MDSRTSILILAGLDPIGKSGLLTDYRYALAEDTLPCVVATALTAQNNKEVRRVEWINPLLMKEQITLAYKECKFKWVKIGLIQDMEVLNEMLHFMHGLDPEIQFVWDPVFTSSSGYNFHENWDHFDLEQALRKVYLCTPNLDEIQIMAKGKDPYDGANWLSKHTYILLKGGHSPGATATDLLFDQGSQIKFEDDWIATESKRGTGCLLSSVITAQLAKGNDLRFSIVRAKKVIREYLLEGDASNEAIKRLQ